MQQRNLEPNNMHNQRNRNKEFTGVVERGGKVEPMAMDVDVVMCQLQAPTHLFLANSERGEN